MIEFTKVGVVGCGLMGSEIGYKCASAGYPVVICDLTKELVDKGIARIESVVARRVADGTMTAEQARMCLARIEGTTSLDDFQDCDLVVEAIVEKIEPKKQVFASLDRICKQNAVLATNTSSLSIIDLAAATKRMARVLGMHFFPPVDMMPLLEISKSVATAEEVIEAATEFGRSLGLKVLVTRDYPGFVVNNVIGPMMLQAVRVLEKGLATAEEVDEAMKTATGHRIGPLALLDYVGLDVVLSMSQNIYEETKDMVWAPPLLLKKMVAAGWLGRKTGKGFYNYG